MFNEGYAATAGDALRATRPLRRGDPAGPTDSPSSCPTSPRRRGLLALMLLQDARARRARRRSTATIVLLDDQDRSAVGPGADRGGPSGWSSRRCAPGRAGPYALQAAIAAVHAEAPTAADTDWPQIAGLYDELYRRQPTPVVALNRAAAVAMALGPAHGLDLVDELAARGTWTATTCCTRPEPTCCAALGGPSRPGRAYERALALATNPVEQAFLRRRLSETRRAGSRGYVNDKTTCVPSSGKRKGILTPRRTIMNPALPRGLSRPLAATALFGVAAVLLVLVPGLVATAGAADGAPSSRSAATSTSRRPTPRTRSSPSAATSPWRVR